MKTKKLIDLNNTFLDLTFEQFEYPWEILPNINSIILKILENPPKNYTLLKDGILIGKNVKISNTATILPPVIIGDNTEIRHCAYLRGNVILLNNCVVGNSCELKNAILFNDVQVPHFNYVGDSILGNHSHLGAGVICSNLKTDKKNIIIKTDSMHIETKLRKFGCIIGDGVEVGCNSVLNPGTIICKNSRIYPLTNVRGVIAEELIVKSMQNIVKIDD
ncbi:MAG: UDP-N-acetylglucosamine pyrophosphorylase [Clostridia bacterium]|nr:UDP-N-acetylglucosamine pyrophosphorylase [Clostridia bacterium]